MIKTVSYKDLVLNTMLDTIRRQNRYTIDNIDIMNYEEVIRAIIKYNELDTTIGILSNGREFKEEIGEYVYTSELAGKQVYTLLPWIDEEDLENVLDGTIFSKQDMKKISEVTKEYLRFSRDYSDMYKMKSIERDMNYSAMRTIENNIESLQDSIGSEQQKLQKVKKRLNKGE